MKLNIQAVDSPFTNDFEVLRVRPQGKQKFTPFAVGISTGLWASNPVTPLSIEKEVQRLCLIAIKEAAIKARTSGATTLEIPSNLAELLATVCASGRLTKVELEAWGKANLSNFAEFLHSVRGHAQDASLPGKAQVLSETFAKAAATNPGWKPAHVELMLQFFTWAGEGDVTLAGDNLTDRILNKLEAYGNEVVSDADAL